MGMPEQTLLSLAEARGLKATFFFGSDVLESSRRWCQAIRPGPMFTDVHDRSFDPQNGTIVANLRGERLTFSRDSADLDVYVCGFMCSPFTKNGQRQEWQHEHSNTFFACITTIVCLRPRCFVLENVVGISNNTSFEVVEEALARVSGYVVHKVRRDAVEFGIPQHRPRLFFVGLRLDALKPEIAEAPQ